MAQSKQNQAKNGSRLLHILAKTVRILSVPPVMVAMLILLLSLWSDRAFASRMEIVVAILGLAVVPVLAYPLSVWIPPIRKRGREGQRLLAMLLSVAGYFGGWLWGVLNGAGGGFLLMFGSYLASVLMLLLLNLVFHVRASGHASSVTGPILFLCYFLGMHLAWIWVAYYLLILWSSLYLGRHTPKDFLWGTGVSIVAFLCCLPLI